MSRPPHLPGDVARDRVAVLGLVRRLHSALQRAERAAIVEIVEQLVALHAPMGGQWLQLAIVAANNGEVTLARLAIDFYVENAGSDLTAPFKKVALLSLVGAWDEADALLRTLPVHLPDPATYAYTRGTAALYLGETAEARTWLERAVRLQPRLGQAWLSLATLVDLATEPEVAQRIIAAQRGMETSPPRERAPYFYALGKARAANGDHEPAFNAFAQGARLMKSQLAYSREQDRAEALEAEAGYDAGRIAAIAKQQAEPAGRTIFVNGLPRSGTTLVEQILASHSAVAGGGEIDRLSLLAKDIGGRSCPSLETYVESAGTAAAARLWDHWIDERFPLPGRVVDKSFTTSRNLGLAAALLPDAPLIWMTRDRLDCAWSCFRNRFTGGAPWSHDLEDIAFHFRLEDILLSRWRDILGDRLLVVPYEELVAEPEQWVRRILAHCGLAEEAGPFAPHETRRLVTTSSVMQVRRPINRKGIGVAEPYREFLQPFSAAYFG